VQPFWLIVATAFAAVFVLKVLLIRQDFTKHIEGEAVFFGHLPL
jgi:hypothetical protein